MSATTTEETTAEPGLTADPLWVPGTDDDPVSRPDHEEPADVPPAPPEDEEDGGGGGGQELEVVCAFVVFQTLDGAWHALPAPPKLKPKREPGNYDLTAGCACVMRDVAARTTVGDLVNAQMMLQQQAQAAAQNDAILCQAGLRGPGGPPGPNRAARRHPLN